VRRPLAYAVACLAVAVLSTLLPWALAFDPQAWLVWGWEVLHLDLATSGGPSWKPLPVLITTPLALLGPAAPWAWLVVARTGGLLALAGAAAAARSISGARAAALPAAALVAVSPWWAFNTALGNSEGILAAAILWAIVAARAGRHGAALALALAAALLRPESWPFLLLYAAWLAWRLPRLRLAAAAALAAVPLLWIVPDLLASGHAFGAADAARGTPSEGSAALARHPALAVLRDTANLMTAPVVAGLILGVGAALWSRRGGWRRRPEDPVLWLAAAVVAWVAIVLVMTLAGFAGTPRYSAPAAAVAAVGAACAVVRALARGAALAALLLVVLTVALQLGSLGDQRTELARRARDRHQLAALIASAGGSARLRECGPIRAYGPAATPVAWALRVPIGTLAGQAPPGAVAFRTRWSSGGPLRPPLGTAGLGRLPRAAATPDWELRSACPGLRTDVNSDSLFR
jgi:hypothetical protein